MRGVSRELFIGDGLRCANRVFPHKQNLENGLRPVSAAPEIVSYYYKVIQSLESKCISEPNFVLLSKEH
jgi:hypothetical protein